MQFTSLMMLNLREQQLLCLLHAMHTEAMPASCVVQVDNYCQSLNHFGAQTLEKLHMLDGLHRARVSV